MNTLTIKMFFVIVSIQCNIFVKIVHVLPKCVNCVQTDI